MATLSNVPAAETLLRLVAAKSFALSIQFFDAGGTLLPLGDATFSLSVTKSDRAYTPVLTRAHTYVNEAQSLVGFDLQASDLALQPDTYLYEIVMVAEGYSSSIIAGELEIVPSTDTASTGFTYDTAPVDNQLRAIIGRNRIDLRVTTVGARGRKGDTGDPGADGDPFAGVEMTYDIDGNITSTLINDVLTEYTYNPDGTIATDTRNGVTRAYTYSGGNLTSITVEVD